MNGFKLKISKPKPTSESARVGYYLIAWMFGVPASLLFLVYLIRG